MPALDKYLAPASNLEKNPHRLGPRPVLLLGMASLIKGWQCFWCLEKWFVKMTNFEPHPPSVGSFGASALINLFF